MDKLKMHTPNKVDENVEKIGALFPNALTEAIKGYNDDGSPIIERVIDFDILKQELSNVVVEGNEERYQFTWPDKKKSILLANAPIAKTLRPCREESVDFDKTENLYIEGDNLDVLKLLQETYLNKVKLIYIDPPYNTGKDFVYEDDFAQSTEEYLSNSGQLDEEGNRLFQNSENNGRFHTDWLNMIYPRLKLAKDLLADDGIIFISIDDCEVNNVIKICNEIFNENNFIAQIIVEGTPKNDPLIISTAHEYCLVYVKNYDEAKNKEWGIANPIYDELLSILNSSSNYIKAEERLKKYYSDNDLMNDNISNYKYVDKHGIFRIGPIDDPQSGGSRDVRINTKTGKPLKTPNRGWSCSIDTWKDWVKQDLILFPEDDSNLCAKKTYITAGKLDILRAYFKIQTRKDTDMLKNMFGKKIFQFPKPVELIKTFIDSSTNNDEIIMDFFSGSATTAHAVIKLNAEKASNGEDCHRKFILVQLQEDLENNLNAAKGNREKQTFQNAIDFCRENNVPCLITEIGKERIRRAGKKIKDEAGLTATNLDIGFRVLKVDSTNMKDVYYNPSEYTQNLLSGLEDNFKDDRTPEDLLFQVMLDLGVPLSNKIEEKDIAGKKVFSVAENYLIACFDKNVSDDVVTEIAKQKPYYAVFRDSGIATDSVATNFEQIFATYSPTTVRKVL